MNKKKNFVIYIIGGLAGALLGVAITHTLVERTTKQGAELKLSPQKGLQIGMTTIGFAKGLLDLFK
ncbi:MAG: hypothetical protein GYA18_07715 [Chloroflexi bacterium]|nr:hypothetical protein [Chloroflexota bacterium]